MTVISRRYPLEIIISPTAVQGEDAPREIARAIRRLSGMADVIIIARGGGSFEDLFAFNNPEVVRAIASCTVPVVSAIGHEIDVTLSDLAADVRAPTPSAAAELVVPDRMVLKARVKELRTLMNAALQGRVLGAMEEISDLRDRLRPQRFLRKLEDKKQDIADLFDRLERAYSNRIERERLVLCEMKTALESRSPLAVLARGYCVAERNGAVVKRAETLSQGDHMKIRFFNGSSQVIVERVDYERDV